MDQTFEHIYHALEEKNWWFVARRKIILQLLKDAAPKNKILDYGCAGGPLLEDLRVQGFRNLSGVDISAEAIALCQKRGLSDTFVVTGTSAPFADASFDWIIASDVLEHIQQEADMLAEWKRLLKAGGRLIVFVPAFSFLWSVHDKRNHHFRRYTRAELRQKTEAAGFAVTRSSYWNFFLFGPVYLARLGRKKDTGAGDLKEVPSWVNRGLVALFGLEHALLKFMNLPFGVSVFLIAQKNV